MSAPPAESAVQAPPSPGAWPMYRALVGVGLLCGLLIVGAFEYTRPIIARNRAEALRAAIFRVVPGAKSSAPFRVAGKGGLVPLKPGERADEVVHAAYDGAGRLVGVAFEGAGMGYQDTISVLFGYSPERHAVVGMEVLESRETPGLGDRAGSDPTYLANYRALDVSLDASGRALAHPIEAVKPGHKEHPWQIDTISGATITSTAVARIAAKAAAARVPVIEASLAGLRRRPAAAPGRSTSREGPAPGGEPAEERAGR